MAEVAVALAVSAITTAASAGLQYALTKKTKPQPVDRGRLDDIRLSAPGFGASLVRGYGTYRVAPIWFWDTEPVDHPVITPGSSGGKGIGGGGAPPTPETTDHYYTKSLAGAIGDRVIYGGVSRVWFNADLVYNANATNNLADTSSTRYEAEHGVLAGGASVSTGTQYSNGFKVTGIGSGGSVTLHTDVETSGSYELAVAYTCATQKTFKVSVNGGGTVDLVCRASGGSGLVAVEVMTVTLTAGANTIAFSNSGASAPDLDCVSVAPALTYTGPANTDPRSFTGLITPGRLAPSGQDTFWPVTDELPVFSDTTTGGAAGAGFYTATLAQWGNVQIRIYTGSEEQLQDPAIVLDKGVDNTPAYRGTPYIVLDTLQITAARPLPNVTVEVQQGMREVAPIITDIYEEVGVPADKLDLTQVGGLVIGDSEGFNPGTYSAITWSGLSNATQGAGGAIHKTSGADHAWNSYATNGSSISAGTDASIRFTADSGTFMIGFSTITTPGGSLPHPYDTVIFGVLLNLNSKPSQAVKNAIQMSLGGSTNSNDVGMWARLDQIQVEIRNGRFSAYQNGLLLGGFQVPVPTFPLFPVFAGYAVGGGPSAASFATGANIGSEPIVPNGGGLLSTTQAEAAELIVDLQTRFQFDMVEVDGVVRAVLRNKDAADLTIPEDEINARRKGDARPQRQPVISDRNPIEIPKTVEVNFLNPQYDYHNDTADDGQLIGGPQRGVSSISLNLIETRQNMKNLAVLLRHKAKMEAREYRFTTGPKYIRAHKGTRIDIVMNNGNVYKTTVDTMKTALPAGVIEFAAKRHAADVFTPGASGFNIGLENPVVPVPGNTKGVFIDAPLVEPESAGDEVKPLIYVAACGRGSGLWPGTFILREFPLNSGQFETVTQTDKQATIGITSGTLPTWTDPATKDTTSSLTIDFFNDAQLESVTEAELLANAKLNLLAVKNPSTDDVEYVQFQTATLGSASAPYIKRYVVTNLFRGRSETIDAAPLHSSADEVVLMNSAVKVLIMTTALLGVSCNYKFVTVGQDPDDAVIIPNTWIGRSILPHAPTNLAAVHDSSGDWYISAVGNPREAERPESYIARLRRNDTGALLRDIPVVPGIRMAAVLGHIVHAFPSGTWSTSTYADISNNNVIGELDPTAAYVTQPVALGTEVNARLTMTPAPAPYLSGNIKLSFGPSDFTDPFGLVTGAIITTKDDNSTTLTHVSVFDWSTNQFSAFDVPTVGGVLFVRVVWSGTEIRWQFSGSRINPADPPSAVLKDVPTPTDPTVLRVSLINGGPSGASAAKVENITIGGLSTPQTIYSLAQQQNDNSNVGIATGNLRVEMWQVAPLAPNQKGLSVKGVF